MMDPILAGLGAREIVDVLYRTFLGRAPDPGAEWKSQGLARGELSLEQLIAEILVSDEYRGRQTMAVKFTNDQSQFGEIELLLKRWVRQASAHQIVVDVGARGRARSNSFDLLKTFGWKGVLFEANPNLVPGIESDFMGLDFEIVPYAISDFDGNATFYLGVNNDVSSLNQHASLGWGPLTGEVTVPVRRLGPLLEERQIPKNFDVLSIDIEGEDIKVLNDVVTGSGFRPRWVIIEASYDFATRSLADLPFDETVRSTYEIVAQTAANLILEHRDPT